MCLFGTSIMVGEESLNWLSALLPEFQPEADGKLPPDFVCLWPDFLNCWHPTPRQLQALENDKGDGRWMDRIDTWLCDLPPNIKLVLNKEMSTKEMCQKDEYWPISRICFPVQTVTINVMASAWKTTIRQDQCPHDPFSFECWIPKNLPKVWCWMWVSDFPLRPSQPDELFSFKLSTLVRWG